MIDITTSIIIGLIIAFLYGVGTFFAKIVSDKDPFLQWIIVNIVGIILCVYIVVKEPERLQLLHGKILVYGVISALMVVIGSLLLYYGLHKGKASVIVPLSSIGPAITAILAIVFLKEQLSYSQMFGIVLIVSGVILLSINS
ncbi:MAG: bacterial/archaeal transporter family protein [Methanothermococcus sp.]|nr:bacterial/archaeal transporter family protein [Methanothermococcus sp.]MDK2987909.1 bacterial/archaeal transporter family protein [Methanothermococcus sp.]